jgi:hypothetical protein
VHLNEALDLLGICLIRVAPQRISVTTLIYIFLRLICSDHMPRCQLEYLHHSWTCYLKPNITVGILHTDEVPQTHMAVYIRQHGRRVSFYYREKFQVLTLHNIVPPLLRGINKSIGHKNCLIKPLGLTRHLKS